MTGRAVLVEQFLAFARKLRIRDGRLQTRNAPRYIGAKRIEIRLAQDFDGRIGIA